MEPLLHLNVIAGKDTCPSTDNAGPTNHVSSVVQARKRRLSYSPPIVGTLGFLRDSDYISFLEAQVTRLIRIEGE
jgi:hypothetical protein